MQAASERRQANPAVRSSSDRGVRELSCKVEPSGNTIRRILAPGKVSKRFVSVDLSTVMSLKV